MTKSVTIKAALIGAAAVLVAALIGAVVMWQTPKPSTSSTVDTAKVNVSGKSGSITITQNFNVPESTTREAIAALEKKLESTSADIELTRNEVKLLAGALRDLDQRTSAIQKLPDGRTMMGGFVGGEPTITLQEHQAAVEAFQKKDYATALEHSKKAVESYEAVKKLPVTVSMGDLIPENVGKLYYLAAIAAANVHQLDVALDWIKKADTASPQPEYKAFQVAVLSDLGRREEARNLLVETLKAAPGNPALLNVKQETNL